MIPQYLNLNLRGGALARLTYLRGCAAYTNAPDVNLPPSRRFADWRAARVNTFRNVSPALCAGYNTEFAGTPYEERRHIWSNFSGPQFRGEAKIHEVSELHISHNGWFANADDSATVCGIVARLPHNRWMAGYYSNDNGERVYLAQVFKDLTDAANAADDEAERVAEDEKEYSEMWRAARNLADDIEALESDIKELIPMRHHARARRELCRAIESVREKRDTLKSDYSSVEL